jgi:16S rRNA C967 or C1407 C5-methylase (RsmB/RsmF family)
MGLLSRLLGPGHRPRDLLADLAEDYRAEAEQEAHLRAHADKARYPQAAAALRRLADVEARHASWLRERLAALGGVVPTVAPAPLPGDSQWARAVAAHQAAQAKRRRLIEQIVHWDPEEAEVVELLRRIEQEDLREHPVYEDLIMRSDPQSID